MGAANNGSGRPSKVVRLIDQYNMRNIGNELEEFWTADDPDERKSLRDLADYFNQRLLYAAQKDAGMQPIESEVANTYHLLVEDDASTADQTRIKRRLEQNGLDVANLRGDFVSYQAVRRYLENHRNAVYSADTGNNMKQSRDIIQRLRNRTKNVTKSKVNQLQQSGDLSLGGNFSTTVDIRVTCNDCGARLSIQELFNRNKCNCPTY